MAFRKFQSVENVHLLNTVEHKKISKFLSKTGKTKVEELDSDEKEQLRKELGH